jgi:hypothetical protein
VLRREAIVRGDHDCAEGGRDVDRRLLERVEITQDEPTAVDLDVAGSRRTRRLDRGVYPRTYVGRTVATGNRDLADLDAVGHLQGRKLTDQLARLDAAGDDVVQVDLGQHRHPGLEFGVDRVLGHLGASLCSPIVRACVSTMSRRSRRLAGIRRPDSAVRRRTPDPAWTGSLNS